MNKKVIIIIGAVVVVAVAVVLVLFVFNGDDGETPVVLTEYTLSDNFVANVKDSNRYVKTTIVLVLNTDTLTGVLDENLASMRDSILFILRSTPEETFKTPSLSELRTTIIDELNKTLKIDNIVDILFYEFVMQ